MTQRLAFSPPKGRPGLRPRRGGFRNWRTGGDAANPACGAALLTSDVLAFALGSLVVWGAVGLPHGTEGRIDTGTLTLVSIFAGVLAYFMAQGHYNRRLPIWWELRQVLAGTGFALLCNSFIEFAFKTDASRTLVLGTWLMLPPTLMLARHLTRRILQDAGLWQIRTVILGSRQGAERVIRALSSEPQLGYTIAGVIDPATLHEAPDGRRWHALMRNARAGLLIIAPNSSEGMDPALNEALVRERVPFAVMPDAAGLPVSGCVQTYFLKHDAVMLSYRHSLAQPLARAAKIALDVLGAGLILLFASPVALAVAVAIKRDGGPLFYAHTRVGAGGRRFPCLKFRSMAENSAELLEDLLRNDPQAAAEWAATQKLRDDPRITRVGAFLRKTSLDELPQLLNVLRLEMSLVGPRPIVENELVHYGDNIAYYYETRPGLTGLWQVSGRSDTSYRERVQLDTWYVKNWTLWHDIAILAKTVPAVLNRSGAV